MTAGDDDRYQNASNDARDAIANSRLHDFEPIALRLTAIGEEDRDGDAFLAAAELYVLLSRWNDAERTLERAKAVIGAAGLIDRRIEGARVLGSLGPKVAALALVLGRINARHTNASPRERGELESRMSAAELVLEGAGLDLDRLEGGYDQIIASYWGAQHAALFRLALSLESLIGDLFPNVERTAIIGTVRQNLEASIPLLETLAGKEIATRLVAAARAASIARLRELGDELFRLAEDHSN